MSALVGQTFAEAVELIKQATNHIQVVYWTRGSSDEYQRVICRMRTGAGVLLEDKIVGLPIMKRISRDSDDLRDDFSDLNTGGHGPKLSADTLAAIDKFREQLAGLPGAKRYYAGQSKTSTDPLVRRLGYSVRFSVFGVVSDEQVMRKLVAAIEELAKSVQ